MSDFNMRLIELVRANPNLYERELRTTPYDTNKKRKTEIWRSISASLKTDVNTCIRTWNHLVAKLRRESEKEKSGGTGSDWSLLPHMRFLQQPHHSGNHRSVVDTNWRSPKPQSPIEEVHNEEDPLQEAMDEQLATAGAAALALPLPPAANHATGAPPPTTTPVSAELLKRIEALLEGLGDANRVKAEKRILAYLCKCNLRALNEEQIDDIVI
ncbi:uncharacterized protein LOC110189939 [Drosophila serrata]|uniref:uncharacterized protein LOC110189939 n=1 Tax=Drosophila serrata TaxID=7274 RepID=UPI000A1D2F9E|nr:uncharacterized protein LOC110189939 [Drosophila serrata]KAH8360573.1 hypothetical protein KR200_009085 [Drosophila serrata]